jgi:hypothetical protein
MILGRVSCALDTIVNLSRLLVLIGVMQGNVYCSRKSTRKLSTSIRACVKTLDLMNFEVNHSRVAGNHVWAVDLTGLGYCSVK